MIDLPPLKEVAVVRLSREGGLAYIPGLVRLRVFELDRCSDTLRGRVCHAVEEASQAVQMSRSATGGDQRFFRVELGLRASLQTTIYSFDVPEAAAPLALVELWQAASEDDGVAAGSAGV